MDEVKSEMYEQAKTEGAWFFCRIEVLPDSKYTIHFDYDDKDEMREERFKLLDNFKYEFTHFPRSKEYTPQWWQDILRKKAVYLK